MSKQTAIKLKLEVGADHLVRLPDEVPFGPVELIVLVDKAPSAPTTEKSVLGLFSREPEIVDEAMAHIRAARMI